MAMNLNVPLAPPILLNAAQCAYDTLLEQVQTVIRELPSQSTLTISEIAAHMDMSLDDLDSAPWAYRTFTEVAKAALEAESYFE
jgi:hypothetical protein